MSSPLGNSSTMLTDTSGSSSGKTSNPCQSRFLFISNPYLYPHPLSMSRKPSPLSMLKYGGPAMMGASHSPHHIPIITPPASNAIGLDMYRSTAQFISTCSALPGPWAMPRYDVLLTDVHLLHGHPCPPCPPPNIPCHPILPSHHTLHTPLIQDLGHPIGFIPAIPSLQSLLSSVVPHLMRTMTQCTTVLL